MLLFLVEMPKPASLHPPSIPTGSPEGSFFSAAMALPTSSGARAALPKRFEADCASPVRCFTHLCSSCIALAPSGLVDRTVRSVRFGVDGVASSAERSPSLKEAHASHQPSALLRAIPWKIRLAVATSPPREASAYRTSSSCLSVGRLFVDATHSYLPSRLTNTSYG